jgi:general secretion pathway protein C
MNDNSPMFARLSSFVIWALVAGTTMFWGLRLFVRPSLAPPSLVALNDATAGRGDFAKLFGGEEVPVLAAAAVVPESTRFKLIGVMAGKAAAAGALTPGLALIAVDGKPARTFAAGARVDDQLVLQSLSLRTVSLGPAQGPASFVLEVPPLTAATTGTLPPPSNGLVQSPVFPPPLPPVTPMAPQPPAMAPVQPAAMTPPLNPTLPPQFNAAGPVVQVPTEAASGFVMPPAASGAVKQRRALVGGRDTER